ncbi:MltA domain-containing protein [cf. Phormidesmis sp. LEGE 11477]|nr:MltA domain-containing protein [cf. Phormidesmis sp. LEGE 11477]
MLTSSISRADYSLEKGSEQRGSEQKASDKSLDQKSTEEETLEPAVLESLLPLRLLQGQEKQQAVELIARDTALFETGRAALLAAVDHSLAYLRTPSAIDDYREYAVPGITHDRVRRSLQRFRDLVVDSDSVAELQQAVATEFDFYQSIGQDEAGSVAFTGYFEPTYRASLTPDETYRYPLYSRPLTLDQWSEPHPTRAELEGIDGLQAQQGPLKGLELAWLPTRLEAFLVQVQGSARLEMTDGSTYSIGYDGRTNYPYTSIGRALIEDGIIPEDELTLPVLMAYFERNPEALDRYIPRNNRFVFFRATNGAPATGSLGYPVTAGRSIATDKTVMPPGALALISLPLPQVNDTQTEADLTESPVEESSVEESSVEESPTTSRFVLDQDTGGAIKGAGRVDLFVGTGADAGEVAGLINHTGALYYLLLKE